MPITSDRNVLRGTMIERILWYLFSALLITIPIGAVVGVILAILGTAGVLGIVFPMTSSAFIIVFALAWWQDRKKRRGKE